MKRYALLDMALAGSIVICAVILGFKLGYAFGGWNPGDDGGGPGQSPLEPGPFTGEEEEARISFAA